MTAALIAQPPLYSAFGLPEPNARHLEKIRALEAGTLMEAMNMLAWDAPIWAFRPFFGGLECFCTLWDQVMTERGGWGCSNCAGRGEIRGSAQVDLMRKHSPRTSSLITSDSCGSKGDQIPS